MFYHKAKEIKKLQDELVTARGELRAERNARSLEESLKASSIERIQLLLHRVKELTQAWEDEHFKYVTLESLLKQLRVNVSLPARKK